MVMGASKKYSEELKNEIEKTHIDLYKMAISYSQILKLTKKHSNDADLGKVVRKFIMEQELLNK
jgi:hypothetical protein